MNPQSIAGEDDRKSRTDPAETQALAALEADLLRRANPEKSRLFDKDTLLRSRETLLAITDELEAAGIFRTGPERVTIVGTNGKGSTAFYLAGLATVESVGLYTSPHFLSVLERIRINGKPVSAVSAWESFTALREILGGRFDALSYFEALTLVARQLFDSAATPTSCALQIFEAGLGGRFDAVHIARSPTIVLTPVELDHMKILGETVEAILIEKLAVMSRATKRLIVMEQRHFSEAYLRDRAESAASDAGTGGFEIQYFRADRGAAEAPRAAKSYLDLNQDFAAFILDQIGLSRRSTCPPPPGRLEWHESRLTRFFYDAGHNPAAMEMILDALLADPRFPGFERTVFFFACLKDRSPSEIEDRIRRRGFPNVIQIVGPGLAPEIRPGFGRSPAEAVLDAETFRKRIRGTPAESPALIAVAGSHYIYDFFIEVRARLQEG